MIPSSDDADLADILKQIKSEFDESERKSKTGIILTNGHTQMQTEFENVLNDLQNSGISLIPIAVSRKCRYI